MPPTELLPCPFCGGEATYGFSFGAEWVECHACEFDVARDTFDEAAAAWNRRAPTVESGHQTTADDKDRSGAMYPRPCNAPMCGGEGAIDCRCSDRSQG